MMLWETTTGMGVQARWHVLSVVSVAVRFQVRAITGIPGSGGFTREQAFVTLVAWRNNFLPISARKGSGKVHTMLRAEASRQVQRGLHRQTSSAAATTNG